MIAVLMLATPALAAHADPLSDARAAVTQSESNTNALMTERGALEIKYQSLLTRIEALKAERGDIDPIGDRELRATLGEARALADQLNALSARLDAARQETLRTQKALVGMYDQQLRALEGQLVTASASEQGQLLAALNALQIEQTRSRARLSELQSVRVAAPIPQLADLSSSDPDELLAAAGELQDHEARLREQLQSVEQRLARLENHARVSKLAEDFLDEDSIFTEDQATIRIASRTNTTNTAAVGGNSGVPTGNGTVTEKTDTSTSNDGTQGFVTGGGTSSGGGEPTSSGGMPSAPATDGVSGLGEDFNTDPTDGRGVETDGPPAAPEEVPTVVEPPVSPSITTDSVIRSDADPNVIVRSGDGSGVAGYTTAKSELKALRAQQRKLAEALKDVSAQERALRERARQLSEP